MVFMAKPIVPRKYRTSVMRGALLGGMSLSRKDLLSDFQKTVATWGHAVNFTVRISFKGPDARILAWTDDYIWNLLNTGTAQRFARFTSDFTAKTSPGFIGSRPGSGRALPSRRSTGSIAARNWTEAIFKNNEQVFNQRIAAALYKGFNMM